MTGHRVGLLLVLIGTLLLSVRGRERISSGEWRDVNQTQLHRFYQTGQWDDSNDYSDGTGVFNEVEDATTDFDPLADLGFHVEYVDASPKTWFSTDPSPTRLQVVCSESEFKITLPSGAPLNELFVVGPQTSPQTVLSVINVPVACGYDVHYLHNTLTVPFSGCYVRRETERYTLRLLYINEDGPADIATASCPLESDLRPRSSGPHVPSSKHSPPPKNSHCDLSPEAKFTCGHTGISSSDCEKMGCCLGDALNACYYPMDECTADKQFVFAIHHDSASFPVDPTKLVVPEQPSCKPVFVNDDIAVFKFSVADCGTRSYEIGKTKIYVAEVQNVVRVYKLKYGGVTRTNPFRFMVECRYPKSYTSPYTGEQSLVSIGYMVKSPSISFPSKIVSSGLFGVELRIAKDQTYSTFYPTYHQPLRTILGKPVYLELRLLSPKPAAVLLVDYCLAYPRSAKNALVLIYEGCANPHNPFVSILKVSDLPLNRHTRRFVVKAFQFMDLQTNRYLDEEIYFMCSTHVCRPEQTCQERCFDG